MDLRVLLLSIILISCAEPENATEVCYICSDRAPFAYSCEAQLGQISVEADIYYCNLYFGEDQRCQTVDTCCEAVGGMLSEDELCIANPSDAGVD